LVVGRFQATVGTPVAWLYVTVSGLNVSWAPSGKTTTLTPLSCYLQFSPGKYTLVAFDAFGDSVVIPFAVTAAPK